MHFKTFETLIGIITCANVHARWIYFLLFFLLAIYLKI